MKKNFYETPQIEVLELETEGAVLSASAGAEQGGGTSDLNEGGSIF